MIRRKRGMTLIELIVAITLFIVVVTLAIGGFTTVTRMKTLVLDMKNTQQKSRLIYETIYRFAKEADSVQLPSATEEILLLSFYQTGSATLEQQIIFVPKDDSGDNVIDRYLYYSCTGDTDFYTSGEYDEPTGCPYEDMLLGTANTAYSLSSNAGSLYLLDNTIPATLTLDMVITNVSSSRDTPIWLNNKIILENVK